MAAMRLAAGFSSLSHGPSSRLQEGEEEPQPDDSAGDLSSMEQCAKRSFKT
jgi:hypothetical protein